MLLVLYYFSGSDYLGFLVCSSLRFQNFSADSGLFKMNLSMSRRETFRVCFIRFSSCTLGTSVKPNPAHCQLPVKLKQSLEKGGSSLKIDHDERKRVKRFFTPPTRLVGFFFTRRRSG